jgi:hypothetical protein
MLSSNSAAHVDIQRFVLHELQIPLSNIPVHADQFAPSLHESELGIECSLQNMLMTTPNSKTTMTEQHASRTHCEASSMTTKTRETC